jgi:hypothetical protein
LSAQAMLCAQIALGHLLGCPRDGRADFPAQFARSARALSPVIIACIPSHENDNATGSGIGMPRKRDRIGTLAAIGNGLPVWASGRFSEDFENPESHRYEDKGVSAARFPALRDSTEDHDVRMTKAGPRRTALSNKRFTAKMT